MAEMVVGAGGQILGQSWPDVNFINIIWNKNEAMALSQVFFLFKIRRYVGHYLFYPSRSGQYWGFHEL